jgi:hypothetical protein
MKPSSVGQFGFFCTRPLLHTPVFELCIAHQRLLGNMMLMIGRCDSILVAHHAHAKARCGQALRDNHIWLSSYMLQEKPMLKVGLTPRLRQSINTLLLFIHVQSDTQASKTAQQRNHNQETQVLRTHPNPSAIVMFSRQVFCTIRAATLHPTPFLRVGPARNFTGAPNDSRPPVYLHGLDGTYATALVCRCVVLSNGPMRLC